MQDATLLDEGARNSPGWKALRLKGGGGEAQMEEDVAEVQEEAEEEEDEEYDEDEVELGLLKPMQVGWDIDRAVGKVGGAPVWLDPLSPLRREDVVCSECGGTMPLLLQLNSPDDTRPHAAARTIYVFACRQQSCRNKAGGRTVKSLRIQTPSPNNFYPPTPENQAQRKELEGRLDRLTKLVDRPPAGAVVSTSFAEWDIACEPEPYQESFLADTDKTSTEDGNDGEDAAEPDTKTGVDRAFLLFQERVERLPEQVLRFYRLPGVDNPEPLWVSHTKIRSQDVPLCPLCSAPREVEFQVLSTLLSYLRDEDFTFDSFLIYTCKENCPIPYSPPLDGFGTESRSGWAEEWVAEQSFAQDGVKFGP